MEMKDEESVSVGGGVTGLNDNFSSDGCGSSKYYSDTSLHEVSSRDSSSSRDAPSYTRDELAQQVILPSDLPPDKMTFLIDI